MSEKLDHYPQFAFDATKVVIYGGGGLSKMIIETVRVLGAYQIAGIIDDNMKPDEMVIGVAGFRRLGNTSRSLQARNPDGCKFSRRDRQL